MTDTQLVAHQNPHIFFRTIALYLCLLLFHLILGALTCFGGQLRDCLYLSLLKYVLLGPLLGFSLSGSLSVLMLSSTELPLPPSLGSSACVLNDLS